MSDEFIETIWAQFAIETEDHLLAMEQILVAGERNGMGTQEVAALFRAVHSLKGLAKALDLLAMERVSHLSENLMGLVREGHAVLDVPMASLLLESVDALKDLREKAVQERVDGSAPALLLTRLQDAFVAAGATPLAVQPAAAAPLQAVAPLALHEDPDMLKFFMQLMADNTPALAALLAFHTKPEQLQGGSDVCLAAREALANMARAGQVMGFVRIEATADAILAQLPENGPITTSAYARLIEAMAQMQGLIRHLEQSLHANAGSDCLAQHLNVIQQAEFDRLVTRIALELDAVDTRAGAVPIEEEMAVLDSLTAANALLTCVFPDVRCHLLSLLEDVLRGAARGERGLSEAFVELAHASLSLVRQMWSRAIDGQLPAPLDPLWVQHDTLVEQVREYLLQDELGGGQPAEAVRSFIRTLSLSPELAQVLSQDNVRDLMAAVQDGWHVYEVTALLETSEDLSAEFLAWVHKRGRVITNRSVFIDGQSWYEMLLLSRAEHDEVQTELSSIDANGNLIKLKAASAQAQAGATPDDATASPVAVTAGAPARSSASGVIRVAGETLDSFMNQVGEMVLLRAQLNHIVTDPATAKLITELKGQLNYYTMGRRRGDAVLLKVYEMLQAQSRRLAEADAQIHSALSRLQERAMALRVVPVETVFNRFPRVVRDLAQAQGKRIRLDMSGQEVRIDKAMVEVLTDPLMHMVRNSVDHGIESPEERRAHGKNDEARISIKAMQQGNRVIVQVIDDGCGIDTEKVRQKAVERGLVKEADSLHLSREEIYNYLFLPGFSTAQKITETSGRGVGMDVVRNNVMRLGGSVHILSELGKGSTFSMEMPLSAAVQDVMLVSVAGQTMALPGRYVVEVIEIASDEVQTIKDRQAVLLRGSFLPLVELSSLLGFGDADAPEGKSLTAVVISNGQQMVGIVVDQMVGRRELFIKDIHPRLAQLPGVGGASILGDGRVVLILDGESLLRLAENARPAASRATPMLQAA
jgi:chemotaxis protein histidine kinase CheA